MPLTKYFCKNGYRMSMGMVETKIAAALNDSGRIKKNVPPISVEPKSIKDNRTIFRSKTCMGHIVASFKNKMELKNEFQCPTA